jgi:hypothetical protein
MYWMKARSIPKYEAPFQKASGSLLELIAHIDWQNSAFWLTHPTFNCEFALREFNVHVVGF